MIVTCSRCGNRVIPKADGSCPSCASASAAGAPSLAPRDPAAIVVGQPLAVMFLALFDCVLAVGFLSIGMTIALAAWAESSSRSAEADSGVRWETVAFGGLLVLLGLASVTASIATWRRRPWGWILHLALSVLLAGGVVYDLIDGHLAPGGRGPGALFARVVLFACFALTAAYLLLPGVRSQFRERAAAGLPPAEADRALRTAGSPLTLLLTLFLVAATVIMGLASVQGVRGLVDVVRAIAS